MVTKAKLKLIEGQMMSLATELDNLRAVLADVKGLLETLYGPHVHYQNVSWDVHQGPIPVEKAIKDIRRALGGQSEPLGG